MRSLASGYFLSVHFTLAVNLPQPRFDRRRGHLRLGLQCASDGSQRESGNHRYGWLTRCMRVFLARVKESTESKLLKV